MSRLYYIWGVDESVDEWKIQLLVKSARPGTLLAVARTYMTVKSVFERVVLRHMQLVVQECAIERGVVGRSAVRLEDPAEPRTVGLPAGSEPPVLCAIAIPYGVSSEISVVY